jgi:hypothetical protein
MKKSALFVLFFTTIITSCDDRLEQLQVLNQPPKVEFIKNDKLVADLQDSLRLIKGVINEYNIQLKVSDVNKNIQFLNWQLTEGNYKLYYQENKVELPGSFKIEYGALVLSFYPEATGNYGSEFKATDRFGIEATGKFNLFVFENLLPVSKLKVVPGLSPNEYIIDASGSYDADRNFNGDIVEYQFIIDGQLIRLKNPVMHHIFDPASGDHTIELKVLDNSGALSEPARTTVTVK